MEAGSGLRPLCVDANLRTNLGKATSRTIWLTGKAYLPTVKDHPMAEHRPLFLGNLLHQIALDLLRIGMLRQPQALAEPGDMRINGNTRHAEGITENHVGGLSANPRQDDQFLH